MKFRKKIALIGISLILLLGSMAEDKSYAMRFPGPVLDVNFPDPTIIKANGRYYAYATNGHINGKAMNIPYATSTDLKNWEVKGDALPQKPSWANHDFWAPHVMYDKDIKKYVMYYSGESVDTDLGKCLGVAYSDNPEGPFIDKGKPLICGETFVNIDPMAFVDPESGKKLLYWGSGHKPIKAQEMTTDWSNFKEGSVPQDVIYPYQEKKYDKLVEGAWVSYNKGRYYIYYSGDNCCGPQANYAVLVARSDSPFGPFVMYGKKRGKGNSAILEKNNEWVAPGHNSIVKDDQGNEYIAYHAILENKESPEKRSDKRVMLINRIIYKGGWPVVLRDETTAKK